MGEIVKLGTLTTRFQHKSIYGPFQDSVHLLKPTGWPFQGPKSFPLQGPKSYPLQGPDQWSRPIRGQFILTNQNRLL